MENTNKNFITKKKRKWIQKTSKDGANLTYMHVAVRFSIHKCDKIIVALLFCEKPSCKYFKHLSLWKDLYFFIFVFETRISLIPVTNKFVFSSLLSPPVTDSLQWVVDLKVSCWLNNVSQSFSFRIPFFLCPFGTTLLQNLPCGFLFLSGWSA